MAERGIALSGWMVAIAALVVVFGAGFTTGRMLPAHHYERFGNSLNLVDTSTGRICDTQLGSPPDPFAKYRVPVDPNAPKNADGLPIVKDAPSLASPGVAWSYWTNPASKIPPCNP